MSTKYATLIMPFTTSHYFNKSNTPSRNDKRVEDILEKLISADLVRKVNVKLAHDAQRVRHEIVRERFGVSVLLILAIAITDRKLSVAEELADIERQAVFPLSRGRGRLEDVSFKSVLHFQRFADIMLMKEANFIKKYGIFLLQAKNI